MPKKTNTEISSNNIVGNSEVIHQISFIKGKNQVKITKSKIIIKIKNYNFLPNSKNIKTKPDFFILKARLVFTKLKQIFIETSNLHYFDLKYHIWIKTNASKYAIGKNFS